MVSDRLKKFARDRRGNIAIMFGLTLPPMIFIVGAAIDYGIAASVHTKLNAAADSAALIAVSSSMSQSTDAQAIIAAKNMFNSAANGTMPTLVIDSSQPVVTVTHPNGLLNRTVTVSYTAQSKNFFSGILGRPIIDEIGSATSSSAAMPNINFYVLLDNSSSMALPATQAGIIQMQNLTLQQNGGQDCAFACHEVNPSFVAPGYAPQVVGNPIVGGGMIDNYAVARNNNVKLRIDEVTDAVGSLVSTATTLQSSMATPPTYQFSVYSIDNQYSLGLTQVMGLTSNYAAGWASNASKFQLYTMYGEEESCAPQTTHGVTQPCSQGLQAGAASSNNGTVTTGAGVADTDISSALNAANQIMPTSGNGAQSGSPQEILFLVTDGVEDKFSGSSTPIVQKLNANGHNYCTDIKNKGILIAVLYTTYFPTPNFLFYNQAVAPIQTQIGPSLENTCASPGLYYEARVGTDLGAALSSLFQIATQSPHLTQ
jgi:Flp pilus assembly protein TadG